MNRRSFHIGPGAASILLIVVLLSMSVLGMLALMNARSDAQLSERSLSVAEAVYSLNTQAELRLQALDEVLAVASEGATDQAAYLAAAAAALPADMSMHGDTVEWIVNDSEGRTLDCAVRIAAQGTLPRTRWIRHSLMTEFAEDTQQGWSLWGLD